MLVVGIVYFLPFTDLSSFNTCIQTYKLKCHAEAVLKEKFAHTHKHVIFFPHVDVMDLGNHLVTIKGDRHALTFKCVYEI